MIIVPSYVLITIPILQENPLHINLYNYYLINFIGLKKYDEKLKIIKLLGTPGKGKTKKLILRSIYK